MCSISKTFHFSCLNLCTVLSTVDVCNHEITVSGYGLLDLRGGRSFATKIFIAGRKSGGVVLFTAIRLSAARAQADTTRIGRRWTTRRHLEVGMEVKS